MRLPLAALRQAGCSPLALELLAAAALLDEDPRFGDVFEHAQGRGRRPSLALLVAWWREGPGPTDRSDAVRQAVLGLVHGGLLQVSNPEAPRSEWLLHLPHLLLDALRGEAPSTVPGLQLRPHATLPALHQLVLPQALRDTAAALPALLRQGPGTVLLLRGAPHNSRRTLLGGVAQALGAGLLLADSSWCEDPSRWRLLGLLALLLDAMPALHADLAAGQTRTLPPLPWAHHPLGVATSRQGAWATDTGAPLGVDLPLPDPAERQRHWQAALPTLDGPAAQALAGAARLGRGSIHRAAPAAAVRARLAGHPAVQPADLRAACRSLQAARLQTLATWLPAQGGLADLAVDTPTRDEIHALAARCRHREALAAATPALAQGNAGVRALLAGASGTGKTLTARLLAAELGKDLYRVDLAATVNKYLGETEKNLDAAFAAAEELDVVLLLDEGDALMAGRTDVGSSNDRYANLETNFLLQRIESFDGILLVTSNAPDRIDKAFARRMDVVIHFRPPDEWRRLEILRSHLAAQRGADPTAAAEPGPLLDEDWLQQMACRCALSGGQWRNVAGHARLLALQEGTALHTGHLDAALRREYRKTGASCPLRPWAGAVPMQPAT